MKNTVRQQSMTVSKTDEVQRIFNRIAGNYDRVNTIISFGRHHYWRKYAVEQTDARPGERILDLCCGTGMMTAELAGKVRKTGEVTGLDFSAAMLAIAESRLKKAKLLSRVALVEGDAGRLPFTGNYFNRVVIGYGLRNVSEPAQVLGEIFRVLKPGGKMVVLETAKPPAPVIRKAYYFVLSRWFPLIGKIMSRHEAAYRYLVESIVDFPPPEEFIQTINRAGFMGTKFTLLTMGAVAVYTGFKL